MPMERRLYIIKAHVATMQEVCGSSDRYESADDELGVRSDYFRSLQCTTQHARTRRYEMYIRLAGIIIRPLLNEDTTNNSSLLLASVV